MDSYVPTSSPVWRWREPSFPLRCPSNASPKSGERGCIQQPLPLALTKNAVGSSKSTFDLDIAAGVVRARSMDEFYDGHATRVGRVRSKRIVFGHHSFVIPILVWMRMINNSVDIGDRHVCSHQSPVSVERVLAWTIHHIVTLWSGLRGQFLSLAPLIYCENPLLCCLSRNLPGAG